MYFYYVWYQFKGGRWSFLETYSFLSQNGMDQDAFIFEHFPHAFASYQIALNNMTAALRCVLILQTVI